MNARERAHRIWSAARGSRLYSYRDLYVRQYESVIPPDTTKTALSAMLRHAVTNVPRYRELASLAIEDDPFAALASFPLMSKTMIRESGDDLNSADLSHRKWFHNSSGGSTGTPVTVIQDAEYMDRVRAVESFGSYVFGLERGQPLVLLWGSMRDIRESGSGRRKTPAAANGYFIRPGLRGIGEAHRLPRPAKRFPCFSARLLAAAHDYLFDQPRPALVEGATLADGV